MRKFNNNKLWRDKLPEMMQSQGSIIHLKELNDEEFDKELRLKLLEEADEVKLAKTKEDLIAEIADVQEVIDTLCLHHKINPETIKEVQKKKNEERGGFIGRKYVTIAEFPENSYGEKYCLANPAKYPEIK